MAANTFPQATVGHTQDPGTTNAATFGSNCTSGTRLVAVVTLESGTTCTVADPTNGAWTQDARADGDGGFPNSTAIFSVANTATSALVVTATFGASASSRIQIYEIANAGGNPILKGSGTNNIPLAASPSTLTVSITSTVANASIVMGAAHYPSFTTTPDTGFTTDNDAPVSSLYHFRESVVDKDGTGGLTLTAGSGADQAYFSIAAAAYGIAASTFDPATFQAMLMQTQGGAMIGRACRGVYG